MWKAKIKLTDFTKILDKAKEKGFDLVIFDDGLQEKKIDYDIKFVCFDIKKWIGNGCLIPSGPLREKIKSIKIEGVSGSNSVKVTLNGDGEMIKIDISPDIIKEDKSIIEDLIVAAHNNAKEKLKLKTTEEISKATGGFGIPGFKWPL